MIQRIQSVYLGIALIIQFAQIFMSWVSYYVNGNEYVISPMDFDGSFISVIPLTAVLAISAGLIVATVFGYSDRKKQMRFGRMALVSVLLAFLVFGVVHYLNITNIDKEGEVMMSYQLTVALPFQNP